MYRVGILNSTHNFSAVVDGFKAKMTELGYVEGENIVYDVQKTDFDAAAYERVLQKFVADQVDLIFVFPTEASLAAKIATQGTGIPVVFALSNIEDTGLVNSAHRPGGNITGVSYPEVDIALKRFEIMRELAPEAKRIWLPYQRGYGDIAHQLEMLYPAAEAAGVTLIEAPVANAAELEADLQARAQADDIGIDAILFLVEPLAMMPDAFAVMGKFATEHKIPIGGVIMIMGDYGSVFEVNADPTYEGEQVARLADIIFTGVPAGTIPVVTSREYLRINHKQAQELGLTVPEGLLRMAAEVIR
jgi:putative ABC transport system substrate-binding protein